MQKEFRAGFELKSLDFIVFFVKRVHLFIGRGKKGKVILENQGTGGEGASGDVEAPPRAQQRLTVAAVDRQKSRLSTDGISEIQETL